MADEVNKQEEKEETERTSTKQTEPKCILIKAPKSMASHHSCI